MKMKNPHTKTKRGNARKLMIYVKAQKEHPQDPPCSKK